MLDEKKAPSKMRTFRFNDAMEKDLSFLMDLWGCTATDALARALTNANTLERMYIVQTNVQREMTDKRAVWETEMKHRIYSEPLVYIHDLSAPAVPEDTSATDELPTSAPVEPVAPIQTKTAAEIEKPTPAPIIKGVSQMDTISPAKDTAGDAAASVPAKTKGGNKVRWQFKIYLKNDPIFSKTPAAPCGETAEIAIANAKRWLAEHGHPDVEPRFKAGKHCTTIRL